MQRGSFWPIALVAVLGITVAANVGMLVAANDPNGSAVEPDYYRRALAWDSLAARGAASARLGWRADARIAPLDGDGRAEVRVRLVDRDGGVVTGAKVRIVAIHNLDAGRHVVAELEPGPDGYAAPVELRHAGMWELRIAADRGDERFAASLRRDTGGAFRP